MKQQAIEQTPRDEVQLVTTQEIEDLDKKLFLRFKDRFVVEPKLSRLLVSFQANRNRPFYRWYKFKEAFSASLVEYLFSRYQVHEGTVLDPFAGSGTTLFAASAMGLDSEGIELLPLGWEIVNTRRMLISEFTSEDFEVLRRWTSPEVWKNTEPRVSLPELNIARQAYPPGTREDIEKYLTACNRENEKVRSVLRFALLCVLEAISYARKDGQYLRWDYRSGRAQGKKKFSKGRIPALGQAVTAKIAEILEDTLHSDEQRLLTSERLFGRIQLYRGSCLRVLPQLAANTYDAVMTSPPYCNRYDYTRTYALELAMLGIDEEEVKKLRQDMLSCTVENRAKDLLSINPSWSAALRVTDEQRLLQSTLQYLEEQKERGLLNNNGIPRMVRGYFYEMACVIAECARVLKPSSPLLMVNDNVRYAGVTIPVDTILSDIAERLGFRVEAILILPSKKGNSSQQMGLHGRVPLRKCVYVWRKE